MFILFYVCFLGHVLCLFNTVICVLLASVHGKSNFDELHQKIKSSDVCPFFFIMYYYDVMNIF